tara:strand:+ start:4976 stop:6490 length:1515 start_codon:yes stop_codon:yes gene_type:complete
MKIIKSSADLKYIYKLKKKGKKIVLCHGVFDLVHIGHINYFKEAKKLGDKLVVSITNDKFVNKGPGRPSFKINQRIELLEQVELIDYIIISNNFIATNVIKKIKPNIYCKGQDYKDKIFSDKNLKEEIKFVKKNNGIVKFINTKLYSSSQIINENNLNNFDTNVQNYINNIKKKLESHNISNLFDRCSNSKILNLGELIIDEYVFTETIGMSGKEATSIVKPIQKIKFLGGSGYISNLLSTFVKNISLLTFISKNKKDANFINKNLSKKVKKIFLSKKNSIIFKKRYIDNYSLRRMIGIYNVDEKQILQNEEKKLINKFNSIKKKFNAIILSDFGHDEITKKIIHNLSDSNHKIYLNCQINAFSRDTYSIFKYRKVNTLIVNESELRNELKDKFSKIEVLIKKSMKLFKFQNIIVTQGKNGGTGYISRSKKFFYYPAFNKNPVDTIGAGDTFFAITSIFLSNKIDPEISTFFGNLAAFVSTSFMGNEKVVKFEDLKKLTYHMIR